MKKLLLTGAFAFVSATAFALTDKPNFVFILIDDMGWADIAADGSRYYKTPNIDRLAAEGVRFTHGYAACAVCSPSRAALMTGQSPARLRITNWIPGDGPSKKGRFDLPEWTQALDPKIPNLPKSLKDSGYATAAIGKWHLGDKGHFPEDCGFDLNIAGGHVGHPASYFWPYGAKGATHRVPGLAEAGGRKGEYLTDRLTDEALKFMDKNAGKKPFFLYLAHYAVHDPIQAKPQDIAAVESTPPADGQDFPAYAAMVKSVDDSVGRVLAEVKKLGVEDNTVVVFTSDNGGAVHFRATKNRPLRGGKGFPYEGGVRVPLIVRAPGVTKPGLVSDTRVIGTDFAPTFLALAHAKPLPKTDGVDITPALRGEKLPPRELGWNFPHYWAYGLISPNASLIADGWKIVRWHEYDSDEIYDLTNDPSEKIDLAKNNPAKLAELRAKLAAWLKSNDAQSPVLKKNAPPAGAPETNPATDKKWY